MFCCFASGAANVDGLTYSCCAARGHRALKQIRLIVIQAKARVKNVETPAVPSFDYYTASCYIRPQHIYVYVHALDI